MQNWVKLFDEKVNFLVTEQAVDLALNFMEGYIGNNRNWSDQMTAIRSRFTAFEKSSIAGTLTGETKSTAYNGIVESILSLKRTMVSKFSRDFHNSNNFTNIVNNSTSVSGENVHIGDTAERNFAKETLNYIPTNFTDMNNKTAFKMPRTYGEIFPKFRYLKEAISEATFYEQVELVEAGKRIAEHVTETLNAWFEPGSDPNFDFVELYDEIILYNSTVKNAVKLLMHQWKAEVRTLLAKEASYANLQKVDEILKQYVPDLAVNLNLSALSEKSPVMVRVTIANKILYELSELERNTTK
jgi:hypothetical protein